MVRLSSAYALKASTTSAPRAIACLVRPAVAGSAGEPMVRASAATRLPIMGATLGSRCWMPGEHGVKLAGTRGGTRCSRAVQGVVILGR
ncbi:hypothetical protein GCM10022224_002300 [Nonomuraea antimicrobica]|uniref:Uncharacterized protein n=1 Tax=Nonomuraea antimicrobica TaxID=561173 RepID=A0ABP7AY54_9ACTN